MQRMGWRPDQPDVRDRKYAIPVYSSLPTEVDLRPLMPPVWDQGMLNSCVGNSTAAAVAYARRRAVLSDDFTPSRLFIYFFARRLQGWERIDEGAIIRDAMKVLVADGVCTEEEWPYAEEEVNTRPPQTLLHNALQHKTTEYLRLERGMYHFKHCLAQGFPFVFGFSVFESFESEQVARTGVVNMPGEDEQLLGGHAVMAVGYDDAEHRFIVRNSWGAEWGRGGYFTLPYEFLTDKYLSDDFWTVRVSA